MTPASALPPGSAHASHWYGWAVTAAPYVFTWGLVFAVVLRGVLLGGFVILCLTRGGRKNRVATLRTRWRVARPRDDLEHQALLGLFDSDRNVALTVGSLGLAAWSVLAAFQPAGIGSHSLGLELLFTGVLLAIGAPLLFRLEGADGSQTGLESMVAIGYLALVFALADILVAVFDRQWLYVIGIGIAGVMLSREAVEVTNQISITWPDITPAPVGDARPVGPSSV